MKIELKVERLYRILAQNNNNLKYGDDICNSTEIMSIITTYIRQISQNSQKSAPAVKYLQEYSQICDFTKSYILKHIRQSFLLIFNIAIHENSLII